MSCNHNEWLYRKHKKKISTVAFAPSDLENSLHVIYADKFGDVYSSSVDDMESEHGDVLTLELVTSAVWQSLAISTLTLVLCFRFMTS